MANPQKENGYVAIANEIVDQLCLYRLSGEEWQVLLVVLRRTYGWNKKEDAISFSQFAEATNIPRPNVIRAIKKLVSKKILGSIKKDTSSMNVYEFNKDYDTWQVVSKKIPGIKKDTTLVSKMIPKVVSKMIHTKDNKPILKPYIPLFEKFWEAYPLRNGHKVGKQKTYKLFASLLNGDRELIIQAAQNYAKSKLAKDGYAKDPERFLKDDYWRDWLEVKKQKQGESEFI